jgi:hypothetical protein
MKCCKRPPIRQVHPQSNVRFHSNSSRCTKLDETSGVPQKTRWERNKVSAVGSRGTRSSSYQGIRCTVAALVQCRAGALQTHFWLRADGRLPVTRRA